MSTGEYLTAREIATQLGLPMATVRSWVAHRELISHGAVRSSKRAFALVGTYSLVVATKLATRLRAQQMLCPPRGCISIRPVPEVEGDDE